jgi:hypothetical protein
MNNCRNKALSLWMLTASVWIFPLTAVAQWILVDDFESYEPGTYTRGGNPGLPYPGSSNAALGQMDIFTGIEGTGGEVAAWFWYGESYGPGDFWHQIPLPEEIPVNAIGTVYFRIWQQSLDLNWYVMISKVAAGEEPDNTVIWNNQAAILRYASTEPGGSLSAHGGSYLLPQPSFSPSPGHWYEYWIILDNAYDRVVQAETAGYSIYRKGPGEAWPRLMAWGTDQPRTKLPFRNRSFGSLKSIVLIQTPSAPANVWLIDDIYMRHGACLSTDCENWCGYPILDGHAETGSWLGWLYVAKEPWVYSYVLDSWLYIPDCPDATGGWVWKASASE